MDGPATPWRAIEDAPAAGGAPAGPATAGQPGRSPVPWATIVGLAGAGVLAVVAFVLAATGGGGTFALDQPVGSASVGTADASGGSGAMLVVEVEGAVRRPGVVRLAPGSRVGDAIDAAGGFGPRVDAERADRELNLAQLVGDGERIAVPSRDDASPTPPVAVAGGGSSAGGLVNLNLATATELEALPGIGPATAAKIIAARAERPFATLDELDERNVIGPATLAKIRDLVTVR